MPKVNKVNNINMHQGFANTLKAVILLSPLPFGCVGKIFSPLFFLVLSIVSLLGLKRLAQPGEPNTILYEKGLHCLFYGFLFFLAWQVIPLPISVLKIISPQTVRVLSQLQEPLPVFHSLSLVPFETIVYAGQFLVFGLFFQVMLTIKMDPWEMITLVDTIVLSAVIQVGFGIVKYLGGNRTFFLFFYPVTAGENVKSRLTGTLGNSNHFAFYLEMVLPLILALFFYQAVFFKKKNMLYAAAAILLGVGIILTGSRGGVTVMMLSVIVFALFSTHLGIAAEVRQKLKIILALIVGGVLLIGVEETVARLGKTDMETETRLNTRWPGTMTMISHFPLWGTGFGTYRYAYYLYDNERGNQWTTHAHNDYLEIFADGGITGGLLLLAPIGVAMASFHRMWRQRRRPGIKMLGLGITAALFVVIVHSAFDFSLRIPANMFIFLLILALGIKMAHYHENTQPLYSHHV